MASGYGGGVELSYHLWWCGLREFSHGWAWERNRNNRHYGGVMQQLWLMVLGAHSLGVGRGMRNVDMREERYERIREQRENRGLYNKWLTDGNRANDV